MEYTELRRDGELTVTVQKVEEVGNRAVGKGMQMRENREEEVRKAYPISVIWASRIKHYIWNNQY